MTIRCLCPRRSRALTFCFLGSLDRLEWTINWFWSRGTRLISGLDWGGGGGRIDGGVIGFFAGFVTFQMRGVILRTILN